MLESGDCFRGYFRTNEFLKPKRAGFEQLSLGHVGLLFFATTFNYLDRQVISYLKDYIFCVPAAQGGFGWSNKDFSFLTTAFTMFYGGMTLLMGWIIDRIGTKLGLALSLIFWSVCGIANAYVGRLVMMHVVIRSAFAVGEAGMAVAVRAHGW